MYEGIQYPLRDSLKLAHTQSWEMISSAGAFWTGKERVAIVAEARAAMECPLCEERKKALSPNQVHGEHWGPGTLPDALIDHIHRIRTDPGRMTKSVFEGVMASGISKEAYIEATSVINASVIIDTMHRGVGLEPPPLPEPRPGEPSGEINADAVEDGAWIPILDAPKEISDTGLPAIPNIVRSLGLVPAAGALFFSTFRPHYALTDIPLSITQGQAEFVASRVSALNQCFY
ncbi:MAG: hypothetical protein HOC23_01705 [Halieaceae bacterium]|jgi:hypothetical protein|nr:hypothetical protein [Halieaceae bacterium]